MPLDWELWLPMCRNNKKIVEFIHIPKCGGWTIHQYFIDLMGLEQTLDLTNCERVEDTQLSGIGMILGHRDVCFFNSLKEYHGYRSFRFAIVREPAERLWSYYRYLSRTERLSTIKWVPKCTFLEFCERVVAKTVSNKNHEISQANYLTGQAHPIEEKIDDAIQFHFNAICTMKSIHSLLNHISRKLDLGWSHVQWLNKDEPGDYTATKIMRREEKQFIRKNFEDDYYLYHKVLEHEAVLRSYTI